MKMKYILRTIFLMFCLASAAFSQTTKMSSEKKVLISELISVIKADEKVKETMEVIFKQMNENYPAMVRAIVEQRTELNRAQKNKIVDILIRRNNGETTFQNRIVKAIDFREYVELTFYPLYDKFFNEAELADLLVFYKSSTGQKSIEIMPQLAGESLKLAQEVLLPKLLIITDRIINEDVERQRKSLSGK